MMLEGLIRLIGWTQKNSYRALEEVLAIPAETWTGRLNENGIRDYVIVSTCNRLEIYYASDEELSGYDCEDKSTKLSGLEAINHLFRVTAGLESMSIGENEILHQVKEAFDKSISARHVHDPLAAIFRKAISSGKLVRRDTRISKGKVSLPALSMDILDKRYGVNGKRIAVIGTGKMASDILKYIQKMEPLSMTIVGRTAEKAAEMARAFNAASMGASDIESAIEGNDVIVTATSSKVLIVKGEMVPNKGERKVFLDISNPRNVEPPGSSDNYVLIDLPSLTPILEKNRIGKINEIGSAESIVKEQVESLSSRLSKLEVEKLIARLYQHAEELKVHEISRLKKALAAGTDFDRALEAMGSALIKKLLASQSEVLRNVHGKKVTEDISEAIEKAFLGEDTTSLSRKSRDRQGNQNQQDQTPQLSRKP